MTYVFSRRSAIEVDTRDYQHPVVKVEIVINGKPAYKCVYSIAVHLCAD